MQKTKPISVVPSSDFLANLPLAHTTEFDLSEKETRQLRYHIYAINKAGYRRFRTLRENGLVLVWRIK